MEISKKELKHFVITIFFVTLALAFDDKNPEFILSSWIKNFIIIFLLATITVLVHYIGHKLLAYRYKVRIEHRVMTTSHFYITHFFSVKTKPIPLGIIASLFVAFASLGKMFFIAIESFIVHPDKHRRVGFRYQNLTDYELAIIASAGPLSNLIFALILKMMGLSSLNGLIYINLFYALFHMIPFSTLDGCKIFFSSFPLYIFSLFLILATLLLISLYSLTAIVLLSLFIASVFTIIFFITMYNKYL
ncbi:M50 family metallopeptidase [Candidatus Woesearchaeota archaeon]|nr:M50 family metallopeptidase [Candidatus Woesearchaeota archaeon]